MQNHKQKPLQSERFLDFVIPSNVEGLRNLGDLHFSEVLAVAMATRIAALGFVLNNFDLSVACVANDFCRYLFAERRSAEIERVALSGKKRLKRNRLAGFDFDLFDFEDVALGYEVLFAAGGDNCNHRIFGNGRILAVFCLAVNKRWFR